MATRASLFLILISIGSSLTGDQRRALVVWNVGQGQWVTIVDETSCEHFDAGGERAPGPALEARCRDRANHVSFSHWDLDHVGFARQLARRLPNACVRLAPLGVANARKRDLLRDLPACPRLAEIESWVDAHARGANALSRVSLYRSVLIPGDAPRSEERRFVGAIKGLARTRWLVLGHHGSRTSTSPALLRRLPALTLAFASARRRRYGHPHVETLEALARAGVPVLTTEDWGSVEVEF